MTENLESILNLQEPGETSNSSVNTEVSDDTTVENLDSNNTTEETNENTTEETEEVETQNNTMPAPNWTFPLASVPLNRPLVVREFDNKQYRFTRVADPDGEDSKKFLVFYKGSNADDVNWEILPGLLTNRYNVVSLSEFVNSVQTSMPVTNTNIISIPFTMVWVGKTNESFQQFSSEESMLLFSILSGIQVENLEAIRSTLFLHITNTYNGTKRLKVDYVLKSSLEVDGNEFIIGDFFTLLRSSKSIIHNDSLNELSNDITNISSQIAQMTTVLKELQLNSETHDQLEKAFGKKNRVRFVSMCENLPDNYNSAYYIFILVSSILNENYDIREHMRLRKVVEKVISEV